MSHSQLSLLYQPPHSILTPVLLLASNTLSHILASWGDPGQSKSSTYVLPPDFHWFYIFTFNCLMLVTYLIRKTQFSRLFLWSFLFQQNNSRFKISDVVGLYFWVTLIISWRALHTVVNSFVYWEIMINKWEYLCSLVSNNSPIHLLLSFHWHLILRFSYYTRNLF